MEKIDAKKKNIECRKLRKTKRILTFDAMDEELIDEMGGDVDEIQIRLMDGDGFFVPVHAFHLKKICSKTNYMPKFTIVLLGQDPN